MKEKTLRDLKADRLWDDGFVNISKLKAEAVKWVKKEDLIIDDWRTAFRKFFNLTEEDLQ